MDELRQGESSSPDTKTTSSDHFAPPRASPVRLRTFVVGLVAVVLVCLIVAYSELVASWGGSVQAVLLGAIPMAPAAVGVIIALMIVNLLVRKVSGHFGLNSAELAVIYFMLVCAAMLSSFGLMTQLLPNLVTGNYFASAQDHIWRNTFYPHIAKWLVPWDPSGPEQQWVSVRFFEGLRMGEHVPYGAWAVPIIAWLLFAFLLFFLMACVATLLRRQWVDNEKLTFPLVQLPMEMMNEETSGPFFRNKAMWLGFAVPVLFHCMNGLHKSLPNVPEGPTLVFLNTLFVNKPFSDTLVTLLVVAFSPVGFAYLLPLDVSFSMWFFLLFFRAQDLVALYLGHQLDLMPLYGGTRFYQGYQSAGAFVGIAVMMVWLARPHLRLVRDRVFRGAKSDVDRDEYMSYRTAFWGGALALLLMMLWLKAAGMNPWVGLFIIGGFVFVVMLVLTRCVSEVGLLMLQPAIVPLHLWGVFSNPAALGAGNLTVISFLNGIFMRDPRNVMPAMMDSMKGADTVGARKKSMAIGVLLAVLIGAFVAAMIQLWIIYNHGGNRLNTWFMVYGPRMYFSDASRILTGSTAFDYRAPAWFSIGTVFTMFLYAMRARFWWWPFHPLGYAIGCAWPAIVYWFPFFVGWLAKSLILRYGGATTYRRFRPFFLGLILGEFAAAILWSILTGAFHLTSPNIAIT